jgi:hypothetical protein
MRLGILGPASDDLPGLARAAQLLLDEAHAEKVIYLGNDGALERVVFTWASAIVGSNPTEAALFQRAAARCAKGTPAEIDGFVESERARLRLQVFVSIPAPGRSIEILDGRLAVLVYDKAVLDEDDIAAAHLMIFGKSSEPMIRKVGTRTFVSPGPIGCANGGAGVLDDGAGGIRIEILGPNGAVTAHDQIGVTKPTVTGKMKVQGG